MNIEPNATLHGFTLNERKEIPEINSTALIFTHHKTGARLLKLESDDDNRVFSISFRTPPADDTGLPHILEHSVLTGSRKFPTKEPFVELLKGSLNTFLNAMTFPDKTMYPVASKNEKDFFNLMDVYLDAVFYPNIYHTERTLMQEGWHHEIDKPEDEITYKGVVYNEMRGAFSSPESLLFSYIQKSLYPDSVYRFESGGDPEAIPSLTGETFLAFHRAYYHPSNSYIFLYGNGDTGRELEFIDREYLNAFDRMEVNSSIGRQNPPASRIKVTFAYPIPPDDDPAGKTDIALNYVTGTATDTELRYGMEILNRILLGTPASPLKQELLKSGLGKDVFGVFESGILQPFFSVILKHSDAERAAEFERITESCLRRLVSDGIDRDLVEGSIHHVEFQLREAEFSRYPKGLFFNIVALESWLYDESPLSHFAFEPVFEKIKAEAGRGYFESLIRSRLLDNTHSSLVVLAPEKGLAEKRDAATREALARYKQSLGSAEIEKLIARNRDLKEHQAAPDRPEDLEKLPMLTPGDINPKAEKIPLLEKSEGGIRVLHVPLKTSKIAYACLIFDPTVVEERLLPYVGLVAALLGRIGTGRRSYSEISNLLNRFTGGTSFSVTTYSAKDSADSYLPRFIVNSKMLYGDIRHGLPLIGEIITGTSFGDPARLREVIREVKSRLEMRFAPQGHIIARKRALSYISPAERYEDMVSGISFYRFIASLDREFESRFPEIEANCAAVAKMIFRAANMAASVTCEDDGYALFAEQFGPIASMLPSQASPSLRYAFTPRSLNEGFYLPQGQVQFVSKACNFTGSGITFNGRMHALSSIVRLDYLWNRVRVQGGAYGAFISLQRNGNMSLVSYRDPNLSKTLRVFDEAADYLRTFEASAREMTKYVIGTISDLDQHMTPSQKGELAVRHYFSNITHDDLQREREEALGVTQKDIRDFAGLLSVLTRENNICVIGSEQKLREDGTLFGAIAPLVEQ